MFKKKKLPEDKSGINRTLNKLTSTASNIPQINLLHPRIKHTQGWNIMSVVYYFNLNKSLLTLQILGCFLKQFTKMHQPN